MVPLISRFPVLKMQKICLNTLKQYNILAFISCVILVARWKNLKLLAC